MFFFIRPKQIKTYKYPQISWRSHQPQLDFVLTSISMLTANLVNIIVDEKQHYMSLRSCCNARVSIWLSFRLSLLLAVHFQYVGNKFQSILISWIDYITSN